MKGDHWPGTGHRGHPAGRHPVKRKHKMDRAGFFLFAGLGMAEAKAQSEGVTVGDSGMRMDIVIAAARLILDEGYENCTMRAIARKTGIKPGSIYHHFASKEEIIDSIMNIGGEDMIRALKNIYEKEAPYSEKLHEMLLVHISSLLDPEAIFMSVYEMVPPVVRRRTKKMRARYEAYWVRLLQQGIGEGLVRADLDINMFASYLLSSLNMVPHWQGHHGATPAELTDFVISTITNGIAAKSTKARKTGR